MELERIFQSKGCQVYFGISDCFDFCTSSIKLYSGKSNCFDAVEGDQEGPIMKCGRISFEVILAANYLLDRCGSHSRSPSTVFFCDDIFSGNGCNAGFTVFMKLDNNGDVAFITTNKIAAENTYAGKGGSEILFDSSQINRAMGRVIVDRSDQEDVIARFKDRRY